MENGKTVPLSGDRFALEQSFGSRFRAYDSLSFPENQVNTVQVLVMVIMPTIRPLIRPAKYGFFVLL